MKIGTYAKTSLSIDKFKRPCAETSLMITIMLTSISLNVLFPKRPYACYFLSLHLVAVPLFQQNFREKKPYIFRRECQPGGLPAVISLRIENKRPKKCFRNKDEIRVAIESWPINDAPSGLELGSSNLQLASVVPGAVSVQKPSGPGEDNH